MSKHVAIINVTISLCYSLLSFLFCPVLCCAVVSPQNVDTTEMDNNMQQIADYVSNYTSGMKRISEAAGSLASESTEEAKTLEDLSRNSKLLGEKVLIARGVDTDPEATVFIQVGGWDGARLLSAQLSALLCSVLLLPFHVLHWSVLIYSVPLSLLHFLAVIMCLSYHNVIHTKFTHADAQFGVALTAMAGHLNENSQDKMVHVKEPIEQYSRTLLSMKAALKRQHEVKKAYIAASAIHVQNENALAKEPHAMDKIAMTEQTKELLEAAEKEFLATSQALMENFEKIKQDRVFEIVQIAEALVDVELKTCSGNKDVLADLLDDLS